MAVVITGNNTPTAGGITYGDGSTYANTAAGTSGQPIVSGGAGAPAFRPYTLPAADGSANQLLQTNGSGALSFATVSAGFTLGTPAATTSGTSVTFTGIPAGVKQVIVTFKGVSTNGTSLKLVRIGPSAGVETSGYNGMQINAYGGTFTRVFSSAGFLFGSNVASEVINGSMTLTLQNSSTNSWAAHGGQSEAGQQTPYFNAGIMSLAGVLSVLSLTTDNGTDAFDAGEVNIAYI